LSQIVILPVAINLSFWAVADIVDGASLIEIHSIPPLPQI